MKIMKRTSWLLFIMLIFSGASFGLDSINGVMKNYLWGNPSHVLSLDIGIMPGISAGAGISGFLNFKEILGYKKGPSLYIDGYWRFWTSSVFFGLIQPVTAQGPASMLGYGGKNSRIGLGIALYEKTLTNQMQWIYSMRTVQGGNMQTTTIIYDVIDGVTTYSRILFLDAEWKNLGIYIPNTNSFTPELEDGQTLFFGPRIRWQSAFHFDYYNPRADEVRKFNNFNYVDLALQLTPDLKTIGLEFGVTKVKAWHTFKVSVGMFYNANATGYVPLYFPFSVSFGFGGVTVPLTESDRQWKKKVLMDKPAL